MADNHALMLLQEERFSEFNALVQKLANPVDLSNAHLRSFDLRKSNLTTANLNNAYLRTCDLRGLDLSQANLEGASIKDAKVSGVLFPAALDPTEIMMSLAHGTRLRMKKVL
jgi:uncharacterized protein YjbI with pentapeptide repeats